MTEGYKNFLIFGQKAYKTHKCFNLVFMLLSRKKSLLYLSSTILLLINCFLLINFLRSGKNFFKQQEVSFSHKMHSKYNISCLFCHYKAETNSYANYPSTKDCMICHIALKTESELLKNVIFSYDSLNSLSYKKIYDLPDYVRFNHSLHLRSGIDCATCHGFVDEMDSTYQVRNLTMGWCVDCHKNPHKYLIAPRKISGISYNPNIPSEKDSTFKMNSNLGPIIYSKQIQPASIECSTCHN